MPRGRLWLNQVTMNAPVCIRPYDPAESYGEDMVSVIIPVLNEAPTIASVVAFAWRSPRVSEVIVVDDGSIDATPDLARAAGARVVTSTMLGKGGSMEDGVG